LYQHSYEGLLSHGGDALGFAKADLPGRSPTCFVRFKTTLHTAWRGLDLSAAILRIFRIVMNILINNYISGEIAAESRTRSEITRWRFLSCGEC